MIKKVLRTIAFAAAWTSVVCTCALSAPATPKPKLVVAIIIDQFRYDYLTRFRSDYHGGLDQLLNHGADFTNAFYAQVPTVTAVGHSIFMSGAMPAVSGIVGNAWYDRDEGQIVTSVCDWNVKTVGGAEAAKGKKCTDADPASPRRFRVTTIGDELHSAHSDSKTIGVSLKARAAILPSGHAAAGAYWFDDVTGNFITSSYYMERLPSWADEFNHKKLAKGYTDRKWDGFPKWNFHELADSKTPYAKLPASPWGNELIEQFAEQALAGEKLGRRGVTDLLTISFSSNDYVGHAVGPDAPEVRDMAIRTDQLLAKFFRQIDGTIGMGNVIVVLSADHGVAAAPTQDRLDKMPGGYLTTDIDAVVTEALNRRFGKSDWLIAEAGETSLYFNRDVIGKTKDAAGHLVTEQEVFEVAKQTLFANQDLHVSRVYSRSQLENGIAGDFIATAEMNGFFPRRSGDVNLVFESGYVPGTHGTSHFSPYAYDRHVPVLFMGPGIRAGHYDGTIQPNDIAPTLATMLEIQTPSGSSGRVLTEMLEH
ncbi:MAG: alkaline phosphatase family protein [Acidobacteriota bacterium]|nr:alkaline phosphatase family protein [Acidobacteriota bacterium]